MSSVNLMFFKQLQFNLISVSKFQEPGSGPCLRCDSAPHRTDRKKIWICLTQFYSVDPIDTWRPLLVLFCYTHYFGGGMLAK